MEIYNDDDFIRQREKKGFDCEENELSENELEKCVNEKKNVKE